MEKRFLNHADIVLAEERTATTARREIGKWLKKFEGMVDLLLKLNYFFKSDKPISDDEPRDWFFAFAYEKYIESPNSIHVCNSLMEKGNYLNAMIQLRSLLDYFVSCRYLHNHSQHVIPYIKGQKCLIDGKEKWLGPSQIHGYFSENFYRQYYGDMLSCFAHGKAGHSIYRIDRSNSLESRVISVSEFNLMHSFSIINHLIPIVYGYLAHRAEFFDGWLNELPAEIEKERVDTMAWIKEHLHKQEEKSPESKDWVKGISLVVGISA